MSDRRNLKTAHFTLAAEAALLPLIAMFAPIGLATLAWVGGVLLLLDANVRRRLAEIRMPEQLSPLVALITLGAVSALWSLDPLHSLAAVTRLLLLLVVALLHFAAIDVLNVVNKRRLGVVLAWSGILMTLLVGMTGGIDSPLGALMHHLSPKNNDDDKVRFNRGIATLAVMAIPYLASWVVWKGRVVAAVLFAALAASLTNAMSMAAPMALAAGLVAGAVVWLGGRSGVRAVYGAFMLLLLVLPLLFWLVYQTEWMQGLLGQYMSWNVKHRLIIWQFATERYFEHPLLGWGLDASRYLPGGNATIPGVEGAEFMPLHPHNGFMQVWLELGVPGALCLALWLGALTRQRMVEMKNGPWQPALATAATAAYIVQGLFSYGIWQNWWIAIGMFTGAFLRLVFRKAP